MDCIWDIIWYIDLNLYPSYLPGTSRKRVILAHLSPLFWQISCANIGEWGQVLMNIWHGTCKLRDARDSYVLLPMCCFLLGCGLVRFFFDFHHVSKHQTSRLVWYVLCWFWEVYLRDGYLKAVQRSNPQNEDHWTFTKRMKLPLFTNNQASHMNVPSFFQKNVFTIYPSTTFAALTPSCFLQYLLVNTNIPTTYSLDEVNTPRNKLCLLLSKH